MDVFRICKQQKANFCKVLAVKNQQSVKFAEHLVKNAIKRWKLKRIFYVISNCIGLISLVIDTALRIGVGPFIYYSSSTASPKVDPEYCFP